jgi:hypothetical protein
MFRWTQGQRQGGERVIEFVGKLDDEASFAGLASKPPLAAILDFAGVDHINSSGIHKLVLWLSAVTGARPVDAERCTPALVSQLNMLPELSQRLRVRSVYVPLECADCLREALTLVEIPGSRVVPDLASHDCQCGGPLLLDEPVERYFAFLLD